MGYGKFNWTHTARDQHQRLASAGAVTIPITSYPDISRAAHVFARSAGYALNGAKLRAATDSPPDPFAAYLPPPSRGSAVHAAALHFYMGFDPPSLGVRKGHTPVSVTGPGCSGSLIALAVEGRYAAVTAATLGNEGLWLHPFDPHARVRDAGNPSDPDVGEEPSAQPPSSPPYSTRMHAAPCALCHNPEGTLFHLICVCQHASMSTVRRDTLAALPRHLFRIVDGALDALRNARLPLPHLHEAQITALTRLMTAPMEPASSDEARIIL